MFPVVGKEFLLLPLCGWWLWLFGFWLLDDDRVVVATRTIRSFFFWCDRPINPSCCTIAVAAATFGCCLHHHHHHQLHQQPTNQHHHQPYLPCTALHSTPAFVQQQATEAAAIKDTTTPSFSRQHVVTSGLLPNDDDGKTVFKISRVVVVVVVVFLGVCLFSFFPYVLLYSV